MLAVRRGGNVLPSALLGFERLQPHLRAFALDHLPTRIVECDEILRDQQAVRLPTVFGLESGAALVHGGRRVANRELHPRTDFGQHVQVGDIGIAAIGVVLVGIVDGAVHVLESDGDARAVVVLEHGEIDEYARRAREDLGEPATHVAPRGKIVLVPYAVGAVALYAVSADCDAEAGALEFFAVAVPNDNVGGFHAGLLQTLADDLDQFDIRRDAAPAERIHFQADGVAGTGDAAPRGDCLLGRCWRRMFAAGAV